MAETSSKKFRPRGSTEQIETEDSDNRDFTNSGPFEQCKASSEKPEYQRRTDRHTGQRAKERKHKWNGFFWEREGSDEIWKTKRIEFQGDAAYRIRTNYGYLESSRLIMTRSENVQKRYGGQMDKPGGVKFRRENSKNDFDFIVRVHTESNRQIKISKKCRNQFRELKAGSWHIYLLHYRADDTIFSNKTGFDQLVSEMDKADVVKMERPIARRKNDRRKFSRVHKKSVLIPSDLADGWE